MNDFRYDVSVWEAVNIVEIDEFSHKKVKEGFEIPV